MRDSKDVQNKLKREPSKVYRELRGVRTVTLNFDVLDDATYTGIIEHLAAHRAERDRLERERREIMKDRPRPTFSQDVIVVSRGADGEVHESPGTVPYAAGSQGRR